MRELTSENVPKPEGASSPDNLTPSSSLPAKSSNWLTWAAILISIAALTLSALSLSGNNLKGDNTPEPESDSALAADLFQPPIDLPGLIELVEKSLVAIECNGYGSGFSMDLETDIEGMNSVIITNYHVIEDCIDSEYELIVLAGKNQKIKTKVEIVGWDEVNDLALLEIVAIVPPISEAKDFARRGWWTMAIGSPVDTDFEPEVVLYNSTTFGQISYVWEGTYNYTSATINGGNSGGPLVNSRGELIGINTFASASTEGGVWNIAVDSEVLCEELLDCTTD